MTSLDVSTARSTCHGARNIIVRNPWKLSCSGVSALNSADSRRHGEFVELTYGYTQDPQEFKYRKIRYSHAGSSFRWRARPANASAMVSNTLDDQCLSLPYI